MLRVRLCACVFVWWYCFCPHCCYRRHSRQRNHRRCRRCHSHHHCGTHFHLNSIDKCRLMSTNQPPTIETNIPKSFGQKYHIHFRFELVWIWVCVSESSEQRKNLWKRGYLVNKFSMHAHQHDQLKMMNLIESETTTKTETNAFSSFSMIYSMWRTLCVFTRLSLPDRSHSTHFEG